MSTAQRQSGRKKRPPAHLSADMDWEEVPEAIKIGSAGSLKMKISLPPQAPLQKAGRVIKAERLPNPASRTAHIGHYISRQQAVKVLPEVDLTNWEERDAIAASSRFAMEWLHDAADKTVEAYTLQTVSEESSVVKTEYGYGAGRVVESKAGPSSEALPSVVSLVNCKISQTYHQDRANAAAKAAEAPKQQSQPPVVPQTTGKRKRKGSKKSRKHPALERVGSSGSSQATSSSDAESTTNDAKPVLPVTEFIDKTTERVRERLTAYLHGASVGSNFQMLNDYNKLQKIRQSNKALQEKCENAERVYNLVDHVMGAIPTDEELDMFEADILAFQTQCGKKKPGRPRGPSKLPYNIGTTADGRIAAKREKPRPVAAGESPSHVDNYIEM